MSLEFLPCTTVVLLDGDFRTAGEVTVVTYLQNEKHYRVRWEYPQSGESEVIKVPEWRLIKEAKSFGN